MVIHGTGCCLADILYAHSDFSVPAFKRDLSLREGDDGLTPDRLVFAEDFERFTGKPWDAAPPDSCNPGGPSIVLVYAAQVPVNRETLRRLPWPGSLLKNTG